MAVLSMPAGISAKIQAQNLSGEFQRISGFMGIPELKSGGGRLGICFESEETEDEWVPCLEHYVFEATEHREYLERCNIEDQRQSHSSGKFRM